MTIPELAKLAYSAYGKSVAGLNYRPSWERLPSATRDHWCAAAEAIVTAIREETMAFAETREAEPAPDGWRQVETTGRVVIVASPKDVSAVFRVLAEQRGEKTPD